MRCEAEKTYINLMIMSTLATTKGRVSVQQIYESIDPKISVSRRSIQRYLVQLQYWGLVVSDKCNPAGFSLTLQAKELISDMARGVA